jgi:protocatechuate 3,4-dioxygenase beta subunit
MERQALQDDRPTGRLLGRREALSLLGASGLLLLARPIRAATGGAASCVVRPQQTAGPFFVEEALDRSDVRSDPATGAVSAGAPLRLAFRVSRLAASSCAPLAGATIHIWHCDAAGRYSDVRDWGSSTVGQKFLRGYQRTDASGLAAFTTIYPGWYEGRAVHVHFKIRTPVGAQQREFTSQLYFDDALSDRVFAKPPYREGAERRRMRNERDGLFRVGGRELMLDAREQEGGYAATFDVALDLPT